jgi:hypothetical protein
VRVGVQIKLIEKFMLIERIAGRLREIIVKVQPFSSISGLTTETGRKGSRPLICAELTCGAPTGRREKHTDDNDLFRRKAAFAAGPGAPSAVSQLRKAETERLKRLRWIWCHTRYPARRRRLIVPFFPPSDQIAKARRCLLALFFISIVRLPLFIQYAVDAECARTGDGQQQEPPAMVRFS